MTSVSAAGCAAAARAVCISMRDSAGRVVNRVAPESSTFLFAVFALFTASQREHFARGGAVVVAHRGRALVLCYEVG